jgi:hypothetical protein
LQALVNSFQDAMNIANNTDVNLLIHPILRLQEIQKEIREIKVPTCIQALKDDSTQYTVSVINYLLIFMNTQDPTSEDLTKAIQSSQLQWQQVMNDFNTVLTTAGLSPQELPQLNQALPGTEDTGPVLINEGPGSVNVRAAPNLDAEVVSTLDAGTQADVLGRTDDSSWIQINFNNVLGWVFTETVTVSVPVDSLPIIEPEPTPAP